MKRFPFGVVWLVLLLAAAAPAQEVIPLYKGTPPGSTPETYPEREIYAGGEKAGVVRNVTRPTLLVFKPAPARKNGMAVVICPGGGFIELFYKNGGTDVANYLNARGITAFVLKYRLARNDTVRGQHLSPAEQQKLHQEVEAVQPLAYADGLAAMTFVREHANEYGISPDRVGIMGFSAGGEVAAYVAFHYSPESRPAFVAALYPFHIPENDPVPADAPPLFVLAATNDNLGLTHLSVDLYRKWLESHHSAELHIYAKGGHGFGMRAQNLPTDHWIERFTDWLEEEDLLKK